MNYLVYRTVDIVFGIIEFAILARVIISWLPMQRGNRLTNKLVTFLYQVTEPILAPIRSLIERSSFGKNMMFDFSPIIAFLLIGLLRNIVLSLLRV
jgi:YggT family protein